jgi:hypothetical protein
MSWIMNKVTALSVLSNAVLVWNSVQFAEIVEGLEALRAPDLKCLASERRTPT